METFACTNCQSDVTEKYCAFCGAPVSFNKRLELKSVSVDIFHSIFHTGGGLLFTLNKLIRRPEFVLKGFIEGKRKLFFSPIKLFLISSVIYLGVNHWVTASDRYSETQQISEMMNHYKYVFIFGNVLVNSFLNWIFFRKYLYNFTEHFIMLLYVQSVLFLISSVQMLVNHVFKFNYGSVLSVFLVLYYVYAFSRVFAKDRKTFSVLLNLLVFSLSTILYYLPIIWLILNKKA